MKFALYLVWFPLVVNLIRLLCQSGTIKAEELLIAPNSLFSKAIFVVVQVGYLQILGGNCVP